MHLIGYHDSFDFNDGVFVIFFKVCARIRPWVEAVIGMAGEVNESY